MMLPTPLPDYLRQPPWDDGSCAVCIGADWTPTFCTATLRMVRFGGRVSQVKGETPAGKIIQLCQQEWTQVRVVVLDSKVKNPMEYAATHSKKLWEKGEIVRWTCDMRLIDLGESNPMMMFGWGGIREEEDFD